MEFYTVKDIAEMLSVNEETVRRWIRDGKLEAERGSGRQGSKVSDASLKVFLENNKGLINGTAATTLGLGVLGTIGIAGTSFVSPLVSAIPIIGGAVFGANLIKKLKAEKQDKKAIKIELMEQEFELEKKKAQLATEIARLQNEVKLIDSQIEKIKEIVKDIDRQQDK
ncbi:helix-turn-helix domain-containing protein [Clostridium butyricum]|jgi:excisionase family DNA binding protein|uniref:helix-turn-helix domain-containing protein n=1 Tax=Clostridium butyricum TaxID=1492 RepID=UPI000F540C2A|nr:helix-turn-helix domain-containing protein [Clostridium butyricum]RQN12475.1 helix-turn-helix domain-containing protein [Clostridium butyricum]